MRRTIALLGCALALFFAWNRYHDRASLIENGRVVLLELAPRDPRALLQGDYLRLRYRLADTLHALARPPRSPGDRRSSPGDRTPVDARAGAASGRLVLGVDENGVGRFRRIEDGTPLAGDERILRWRRIGNGIRFAGGAWFVQEGTADQWRGARYGLLRVNEDGDALLSGLLDENWRLLKPGR